MAKVGRVKHVEYYRSQAVFEIEPRRTVVEPTSVWLHGNRKERGVELLGTFQRSE